MKKLLLLLFFISCISCQSSEPGNEILEVSIESRQSYIDRNVEMINLIMDFVDKNRNYFKINEKIIDGDLYKFYLENNRNDKDFNFLIKNWNLNNQLNFQFNSSNKYLNKENLNDEIFEKILRDKFVTLGELKSFEISNDRKSCIAAYNQNISDCRSDFLRGAIVSVISAGIGGFVGGAIPAFDTAWTFYNCQNRAQRNFDYCMGNI